MSWKNYIDNATDKTFALCLVETEDRINVVVQFSGHSNPIQNENGSVHIFTYTKEGKFIKSSKLLMFQMVNEDDIHVEIKLLKNDSMILFFTTLNNCTIYKDDILQGSTSSDNFIIYIDKQINYKWHLNFNNVIGMSLNGDIFENSIFFTGSYVTSKGFSIVSPEKQLVNTGGNEETKDSVSIFLSSVNLDGKVLELLKFPENFQGEVVIQGVTCLEEENKRILVVGQLEGTLKFDSFNVDSNNNVSSWYGFFNSKGICTSLDILENEEGYIAVLSSVVFGKYIYFTGLANGNIKFDKDIHYNDECFILCLDCETKEYVWSKHVSKCSTPSLVKVSQGVCFTAYFQREISIGDLDDIIKTEGTGVVDMISYTLSDKGVLIGTPKLRTAVEQQTSGPNTTRSGYHCGTQRTYTSRTGFIEH